jgi:sec-independent protein translocase protein TatB
VLNFSPEKLFLVGLIALVVLGPNRLPHAARTLGRMVAELRRMSNSFHQEVRDAMGDTIGPLQETADSIKRFQRTNVRQMVQDTFAVPPDNGSPALTNGAPGAPVAAGPPAGPHPSLPAPDDPSLN